jgi:hypothetical protein
MGEIINVLIHSVKKRGFLKTTWRLSVALVAVPLSLLNEIAEAYSDWFYSWDYDQFGL